MHDCFDMLHAVLMIAATQQCMDTLFRMHMQNALMEILPGWANSQYSQRRTEPEM